MRINYAFNYNIKIVLENNYYLNYLNSNFNG